MWIWLQENINSHDFIDKKYWKNNYELVKNEYIPKSETYIYEDNWIIKWFVSIVNNEYIWGLFIDNTFQRQWIWTELIRHIIDKHNELSLCVYCKNTKAINFYLKNWFEILSKQIGDDWIEEEYLMTYKKEST